jgi:hypothetical protein
MPVRFASTLLSFTHVVAQGHKFLCLSSREYLQWSEGCNTKTCSPQKTDHQRSVSSFIGRFDDPPIDGNSYLWLRRLALSTSRECASKFARILHGNKERAVLAFRNKHFSSLVPKIVLPSKSQMTGSIGCCKAPKSNFI